MRFNVLPACLLCLSGLLCCLLRAGDPAKVLSPEAAAKRIGERVTVEMEVKSTGGNSAIFLNSQTNFRSPENFAVVIFRSNLERFRKAAIDDPAVHYKGKTIQVTGLVESYREHVEIKVDDPAQIKVVDKDAEAPPQPATKPVKRPAKKK